MEKDLGSRHVRPDDIRFTEALPKTRSGKIMRRLLRDLATHGEIKGDVTTIEDFTVIARLREAEAGQCVLTFNNKSTDNKPLLACGVPQVQRPFVRSHGGFCF